MKKNVFLFSLLTLLFSTSCLDNNESSFSGSNQFAVVQQNSSNIKYIVVPNGMIQNDVLNNYDQGDALILSSYSANLGNTNSLGIVKAESIIIDKNFPNRIQKSISFEVADTAADVRQQIGLKQLIVEYSANKSVFLDRSLVTYSADLADGEKYNLNFYYDKTKQVDQTGATLTSNRIVLDIVIDLSGEGIGQKKTVADQLVLNSSELRAKLTPTDFPDSSVVIVVDFRYSLYNASTQKYQQVYSPDKMRFTYYKSL